MSHWAINSISGTIHEFTCFILNRTKIKNIEGINKIEDTTKLCKICKPDPNEYQSQIKEIKEEDKEYRTYLERRKETKHNLEVKREMVKNHYSKKRGSG